MVDTADCLPTAVLLCVVRLSQHGQAYTLLLSFTYTFIFHQSLSLTLEAPNIRSLLSQPSFSRIKVLWSSSSPLNWGKCHNTFWERLSTPPTKYIHGQKHCLSLLSGVSFRCEVCNCLSHLTMSMGEQEDGLPEPLITSPPWRTFLSGTTIWSMFKSVLNLAILLFAFPPSLHGK